MHRQKRRNLGHVFQIESENRADSLYKDNESVVSPPILSDNSDIDPLEAYMYAKNIM